MKHLVDFIRTYRQSVLYVVTAFFMMLSGYLHLLGVAGGLRPVSLELLLEERTDAVVFVSALVLLLDAGIGRRWPRLAAVIALLCSVASLPYSFQVLYYSFFAASLLICVLPGAYLLIWIPLAFVLATATVSIRTLLSARTTTR